jgi:hypothetical protein
VSDTYNYDDHRVHLSDSDSDKNGAASLNYHLDVQLDGNWPGMSPDPHKQRFDVHKMREAAGKIDELIAGLTGAGTGTPQSIAKNGSPSFGPDSWAAAKYLKTASDQVVGTVSKYTTDLVTNLTAAANSIRAAADAYDKSENANKKSGSNQQASLEGTPSSFS